MIDPDAPPLGVGGNGSQAFLHWMQDGLTSAPNSVTVQGKTVFPLENAGGIAPIQAYQYISPIRNTCSTRPTLPASQPVQQLAKKSLRE